MHVASGSRDKRLLAALAAFAAAVGGVAVVVSAGSSPASDARCVVVDVPSTMGGARLRACGPAATSFCRTQSARDERVAAACRRRSAHR